MSKFEKALRKRKGAIWPILDERVVHVVAKRGIGGCSKSFHVKIIE